MSDYVSDSRLERILKAGHLGVTSECGPPRGSDAEEVKKKGLLIKDYVDAVNVTDNQTAMTRMSSLAACIHLKLLGIEPVLQMVTRDRNRVALQSDILGAASFDIPNMLCLSGDHQSFGDCAQGQNVHDLDSMQLVQTVRHMRDEGKFLGGDAIKRPPRIFVGAAANPFADPFEIRVRAWQRKSPAVPSSSRPSASTIWTSSRNGCGGPWTGAWPKNLYHGRHDPHEIGGYGQIHEKQGAGHGCA
jgi:methylenetetrahydrofolate reductase (NADPH)